MKRIMRKQGTRTRWSAKTRDKIAMMIEQFFDEWGVFEGFERSGVPSGSAVGSPATAGSRKGKKSKKGKKGKKGQSSRTKP